METSKQSFLDFFRSNFLGFSILISAALIAGAIFYTNYQKQSPYLPESPDLTVVERTLDISSLPTLGDKNAPVKIIEFGDYQCPFCARFFRDTEPKILEEYIRTGKASLSWHDFAFLGEESIWAAEAARCAGEQGKYWEYHHMLFERQAGENRGAFSKANLKQFARDLGLGESEFALCLDSGKYRSQVEADTRKGAELGVSGTPTTFVNGRNLVGTLPFDTFKEAIEASLAKSR